MSSCNTGGKYEDDHLDIKYRFIVNKKSEPDKTSSDAAKMVDRFLKYPNYFITKGRIFVNFSYGHRIDSTILYISLILQMCYNHN